MLPTGSYSMGTFLAHRFFHLLKVMRDWDLANLKLTDGTMEDGREHRKGKEAGALLDVCVCLCDMKEEKNEPVEWIESNRYIVYIISAEIPYRFYCMTEAP